MSYDAPFPAAPTLPADVRASLRLVVRAYLTCQEAQIALPREQIAALQGQLTVGVTYGDARSLAQLDNAS